MSFARFYPESQVFGEEEHYLSLFSGSTKYFIVNRVYDPFRKKPLCLFKSVSIDIDL